MTHIPKISLGTYRIRNTPESIHALRKGIELGYKSIDTAQGYKNEEMIPLVSDKVFITSKIAPNNQGEKARNSITDSLRKLNVLCLDLMLIHWPGSSSTRPDSEQNFIKRSQTYKELLKAQKEGLIKHVGVSNYTKRHLEELEIAPYLNQIEFHPLVYDDRMKELLEYCKKRDILVQAYSPLAEGKFVNQEWEISEIIEIAKKRNATVAQVLIKWVLDKGVLVVVKSSRIARLKENLDSLNVKLLQEVFIFSNFIGY
jgi:diketogulonate reductase-like aldo/keto reductase